MPNAIQNPVQVPPSVVQGLRDTLYTTINEISSLKDENKALKTEVGKLKNSQVKVSQLQEALTEREEVLQRPGKTAHVKTMDMLARTSEQWSGWGDALEERLISNANKLQKHCLRSSLYLTIMTCWILSACVELPLYQELSSILLTLTCVNHNFLAWTMGPTESTAVISSLP